MQEPVVAEAMNSHVCADPDKGVAVNKTVAPLTKLSKVNVGVSSAVLLSLLELPKSDAA